MTEEIHRMTRILEIYLSRAETAYESMASENWAEFQVDMRQRNIAFYNFRAADHLMRFKDPNYLLQPHLFELANKIRAVDKMLAESIKKYQGRLNQQLIKIHGHRAKISKFHSGGQDQAGFQKTV